MIWSSSEYGGARCDGLSWRVRHAPGWSTAWCSYARRTRWSTAPGQNSMALDTRSTRSLAIPPRQLGYSLRPDAPDRSRSRDLRRATSGAPRRLASDEGDRSEHLSASLQLTGHDRQLTNDRGRQTATQAVTHSVEQRRTDSAGLAAHDHQGRVKHRTDTGERLTYRATAVAEDALRTGVAGGGQANRILQREPSTVPMGQRFHQRPATGHRLEAASTSATTDRAVRSHYDVTEFAGRVVTAAEQMTVEDQPGTQAVRDHDVDEVVDAASGAEGPLCDRAEVRVITHQYGRAEPIPQFAGDVHPSPVCQKGRAADVRAGRMNRRGH